MNYSVPSSVTFCVCNSLLWIKRFLRSLIASESFCPRIMPGFWPVTFSALMYNLSDECWCLNWRTRKSWLMRSLTFWTKLVEPTACVSSEDSRVCWCLELDLRDLTGSNDTLQHARTTDCFVIAFSHLAHHRVVNIPFDLLVQITLAFDHLQSRFDHPSAKFVQAPTWCNLDHFREFGTTSVTLGPQFHRSKAPHIVSSFMLPKLIRLVLIGSDIYVRRKPVVCYVLFCFIGMRSTEPGCFRLYSWCLWKAFDEEGCLGLVPWRLDVRCKSSWILNDFFTEN